MLDIFMGQCARDAAYHDVTSLNEPANAEEYGNDDAGSEIIDSVADPLADVEIPLMTRQAEAMVHGFIADLPPALRCIVFRHFWLEQTQAQIAAELGVTRSAICHALTRVLRRGRSNLAALAPC